MAKRRYWLMKSEPDVYSIDHLAKEKQDHWDGIRNYQARNHMRDMAVGDMVLFYHSNADPPGVAGVCKVCKTAYPDHTQFDKRSKYFDAKSKKDDPRWWMVDVEFVEKLPEYVPLATLRDDPALAEMLVIRKGMRLSVQPVDKDHFKHGLKLARARTRVR